MPQNLLRKTLTGYFMDVVEDRANPYKQAYESVHLSPGSEMIERRYKASCLDAHLIRERERSKQVMQGFAKRWDAAAEKMKALEENILKLDVHYKESGKERERYLALVKRQNELKMDKMQDVNRLEKEKAFLEEVRLETNERLERFKPVKAYLEKAQEASKGQFRSIRELFDSYDALSKERAEMTEIEDRSSSLIAGRQKVMDMLSSVKVNECVLLSNEVYEFLEELDILKTEEARLDQDLSHIKITAAQRAMDLGKVRIATYNLYLQMCRKRNRIARITASDSIAQLQNIESSMVEMNKLRRYVRHILKLAKEASEADKLEANRTAREAHKKALRAKLKSKLNAEDMFGLFRIAQEKNWYELEEPIEPMALKLKNQEKKN